MRTVNQHAYRSKEIWIHQNEDDRTWQMCRHFYTFQAFTLNVHVVQGSRDLLHKKTIERNYDMIAKLNSSAFVKYIYLQAF